MATTAMPIPIMFFISMLNQIRPNLRQEHAIFSCVCKLIKKPLRRCQCKDISLVYQKLIKHKRVKWRTVYRSTSTRLNSMFKLHKQHDFSRIWGSSNIMKYKVCYYYSKQKFPRIKTPKVELVELVDGIPCSIIINIKI